MPEKILITSALPYVNGPIHFGHIAGAYLPGDVYARFQRLQHNDVLYICGSDEYGVAITMSADIAGRTPKEHVDIYHKVVHDFFKQLSFSFDHYSRTTWEGHVAPVQQYFKDLYANGYIEERVTDQLYSEQDQRFLADRYVIGTCPKCGFENARGDECPSCGAAYEATDLKKPRSKLTGSALVLKPTKHFFLLLDKFKDRLEEWIATKNWKPNVANYVKNYVKDLHPRAITRDSIGSSSATAKHRREGAPCLVRCADRLHLRHQRVGPEKAAPSDGKITGAIRRQSSSNSSAKTTSHSTPSFSRDDDGTKTASKNFVDELPANEFYNLEGKQFI